MRPTGRTLLLVSALSMQMAAVGCVPAVILDRDNTCDRARSMRQTWAANPPTGNDLIEASTGTEALGPALDAERMTVVAAASGAIGSAALVGGLVSFFVVKGDNDIGRDAGYGLVGGAIGTFALGLALTYFVVRRRHTAMDRLLFYADHCDEARGASPLVLPPPAPATLSPLP